MEWMGIIVGFWLTALAWWAGLSRAFRFLERRMPCNPGMYWWKDLRAAATDCVYWFVVPLFIRVLRTMMYIGIVSLLFGTGSAQLWPLASLPLWQQCLAILLIQDVMLYWSHRLFHTRAGWKFHAVHHSPKQLDWMSTTRFHPVNNVLSFGVADIAILLMGFSAEAVVILTPFNIIYSALVHANLNWTFGPLRYVFASPVYHRWHHTSEEQGLDKNFASTFPFLDLLFGTYYMPAGKLPEQFGNGEPDYPDDFLGQLLHPFRLQGATRPRKVRPLWVSVAVTAVIAIAGGALLIKGLAFAEQLTVQYERRVLEAEQANEQGKHSSPVQPAPVGHRAAVLGVAISADGQRIVSGGEDCSVKVWDAATGEELFSLVGHTRAVRAVAFSADGRHIVSGSYDRKVKVWDVQTRRLAHDLVGHTGGILCVAVSGDGRQIVSGGGDFTTRVWDTASGREQQVHSGPRSAVLSVAVSRDLERVAEARGETVFIRDAVSGHVLLKLEGHEELVESVAFSADGRSLVSGSADGTVKVWNATTGKELLTLNGHTGAVYSVAFGADGHTLISAGEDRTVKLWDAATGRLLRALSGHTNAVTSVAISVDGRTLVSGSRDGTMRIWDMEDALRKQVVQRH